MPEDTQDREALANRIFGPQTNITAPSTPESMAAALTSDREALAQRIFGQRVLGLPTQAEKPSNLSFSERNARPGIYMDPDLELTSGLKTQLLMREKPEDKVSFLENLVGKGNVRLADNGEPIVTTYDQSRKQPVEFRAMGAGANIIPHAQALIPETAATMAASELAAARIPATANKFLKFAAEMIAAGTGQELGGIAKDIAVSSTPLDAIIAERAKRVPEDVAANAILGGTAKLVLPAAGRVISPFGGTKEEIEAGAAEARQFFLDKFGIDYRQTPGERTGSPLFKRVEATVGENPGGTAALERIRKNKIEDFRKIQARMLGSKITPEDIGMLRKLEADVGEEAIAAIKQNMDPLLRAQETSRNAAAGQLSDAIMNELAQATGPTRQLYPERVGAKLRRGAAAREDAFKQQADALYAEAYSKPGGVDKLLEPPNLKADAQALLDKLPAPEVTTTTPTGTVGPTGQPLTTTTTGKQLMQEFVPEGVVPMLKRLANLDQPKFSLQDLVQMRTDVRNSIKRGAALGNVKDHYLGEVEDMLTKAINEGTAQLPNGDLKAAWQKANDFYAQGAPAFKEKNIARLFKDKETGAFVQDEDLVRNIGPSEYNSYKAFFGENSPEFQALKRGIVDQLVPQASGELVDASKFVANLRNFIEKNRSVAEDVLGVAAGATSKEHPAGIFADLLGKVQAGDKLSLADLNAVAAQGKLGATGAVRDLVEKQRALTEAYRSSIVKDIAEGKLGENFDAGEFINRLWDNKTNVKEIQAIRAQLANHPEVLQDLERKAAARIFDEAQAKAPLDPVRLNAEEPFRRPTTTTLERVFGSDENKAKMAALLGPERMKEFEQLANLLRGGEAKEAMFGQAATLAKANNIQKMLRGDLLSYLPMWLQQRIVATIYFSKPIGDLLTNQVGRDPQAIANLARAVVTSQPFISAMGEDFGDKTSEVIGKILDSIMMTEQQGPPGTKAVGRQSWLDAVLGRAAQGQQRVFPAPPLQTTNAPTKGK